MEGVRVPGQAGRSESAAAVRRALSTSYRLANLVRSDGIACRISLDAAFCLETSAQRSRHALAPGEQSLSGRATSLHSARLYRYQFAPGGEKAWWKREPIGEWLPAFSTDSPEFLRLLEAMDWVD